MKIAHISDTHIRSLSRHDEFRQVFDELYYKLLALKPDQILHTGDLFHTKRHGITPEYITLLMDWFKSLAEIAPLTVILGNHDGLLHNLSLDDAVSPIINAMNNPRINLYKKSGVYNFAPGYNWCVYSIFDKDGWDRVAPIAGDVNIALYHGPVWGAVTEQNWELEGDMNAEFFSAYNACMLGDIHKMQFLGTREYEIEIDEADLDLYPNAVIVEK